MARAVGLGKGGVAFVCEVLDASSELQERNCDLARDLPEIITSSKTYKILMTHNNIHNIYAISMKTHQNSVRGSPPENFESSHFGTSRGISGLSHLLWSTAEPHMLSHYQVCILSSKRS